MGVKGEAVKRKRGRRKGEEVGSVLRGGKERRGEKIINCFHF